MSDRRDDKGRILRTGEGQRANGRYMYQYTDISGKRRSIYSSRLEKKDKYPPGYVKKELSLREKEAEILRNKEIGLYDFVAKYNGIYKIQLPNITPYVCRNTFCSKMARKGMNPKNLQYIMGHFEYSVTMDTYTELEFDDALEDFRKVLEIEEAKTRAKTRAVR